MNLQHPGIGLPIMTFLVTAGLPLAITAVAIYAAARERFPWTTFGAVSVILVLLGAVMTLLVLRNDVSIRDARLEVKAALYSQTVDVNHLDLSKAKVVDFSTTHSELRPTIRTNGIGLPGYQAGWFRTASGERLFLAAPGSSPNLYIPTTEGFALLLAVEEPVHFLETLRAEHR